MMRIDEISVVRRTFALYREHARIVLPPALLLALLNVDFAHGRLVLTIVESLVVIGLSILYQGMVVQLILEVDEGRRDRSLRRLWQGIRPVSGALLGAAALACIGIGIGFVLLVIPGVLLMTWWSVVGPAVVVERRGVLASFARSYRLVRGNDWSVFAVLASVGVLTVTIRLLALLVATGVAGAAAQVLVTALLTPVWALLPCVLYFTLRKAHGEDTLARPGVAPGDLTASPATA
jgi:hypothetical protein